MAEDEELRINALRQELMREIESVKGDIDSVGSNIDTRFNKVDSDINNVWRWVVGLVTVFGVIATLAGLAVAILAAAANII